MVGQGERPNQWLARLLRFFFLVSFGFAEVEVKVCRHMFGSNACWVPVTFGHWTSRTLSWLAGGVRLMQVAEGIYLG